MNKSVKKFLKNIIVSGLSLAFVSQEAFAFQVPNTASMKYKDVGGKDYNPASNTVITVRKNVPGIDLTPLVTSVTAPPFNTWNYPVCVTNTGTYNTDYALSLSNIPSGINTTLFDDKNNNGLIDQGENAITNSPLLKPADKYCFIASLKDNIGKKNGDVFDFNVNAVSNLDPNVKDTKALKMLVVLSNINPPTQGTGGGSSSSSTVTPTPTPTATPNPTLTAKLKKEVFPKGTVKAGDTLTYYLAFNNENDIDLADTTITDKIPDNTTLVKESGAEPVADNGGKIEYSENGSTWTDTIQNEPKYIRAKYSLVNKLQTVTAFFKVKINSTIENGIIENRANSEFRDPIRNTISSASSNIVTNDILNEYSIVGTVYDLITGLPKENVKIEVFDKDGKKVGEVLTGKTGKYKILVPTKGNYRTVITDSDGVVINDKKIAVEKPGEKPTPIEFGGKLISNRPQQEDFTDMKVELLEKTKGFITEIKLDKNGRFLVDADKNGLELKPGTYFVRLTDKDGTVTYAKVDIFAQDGDTFLNLEVLIDPFGIVYDCKGGRNVRIDAAQVKLTEGSCPDTTKNISEGPLVKLDELEPGVPQKNPFSTDVKGIYQFFLNKEQLNNKSYCLTISKGENYSKELFALKTAPSTEESGKYNLTVIDKNNNKKVLKNIESVPNNVCLETKDTFNLNKAANKSTIEIGDIVTYKIEATNKLAFKVKNAYIEDILPEGFKYVQGSLYVNGTQVEDFTPENFYSLKIPVGDLQPEQKVTVIYQLRTGIKTIEGPAKNKAKMLADSPSGNTISGGDTSATVLVKKGVFSKNGSIIGRVYIDDNNNGLFDEKEQAVENIIIYTSNGMKITTDNKGKYSIPDLPYGDILLSVDKNSLPKDVYLVEDAIKVSKEIKNKIETSTVSELDINKAITYNVAEGKDLTIKNSSGLKAVIELKDGSDFIVKNLQNMYATTEMGLSSQTVRIISQKELGLNLGMNNFKVKFFDANNKQIKTKKLAINVLPEVKEVPDETWIGDTGYSRRITIPESGLAKANFRLVKIPSYDLSLKTSEEEKEIYALKAVYVYPNKFATKLIPYMTYPDIEKHWAKEVIEYESGLEIIHGYPDGTFKPERSISRAEATKLTLVAIKSFDVKIGTSLGYIIDKDAKVTARILDKNGLEVKTLISDIDRKAGVNVLYWDGKGNNNKFLPPNNYTFEVEVTTSDSFKKLATNFEVVKAKPNYHPEGKANFSDVPDWFWGSPFIKVAVDEKLIDGYENGNFLPDKFIPRYEMAMLAIKALKIDPSLAKTKLAYKDLSDIPEFARPYVDLADTLGLLKAKKDGMFYPLRNTNRADIANLVLELINKQKIDANISGTFIEELKELFIDGKKVNLENNKFLVPMSKPYSEDINVDLDETNKLKVYIDELYKTKGVKRGLFDSFGN
ncbi:MAG: S-layer homology domain-containing protein [Candidatus Sericytochromatia bacterium]